MRLSKNVEQFKNDLKRSEIKFGRFNELQIESLKRLYDQTVTFHFKYNNLVYPIFYTHDTLRTNLENFKREYNICMEYFHRNRIFLTDEIFLKIKDIETNFKIIRTIIDEEIKTIRGIEERNESINPIEIYNSSEDEVKNIKKRIEILKSKVGVLSFEMEIQGLRTATEVYFKELTK